MARSIRSNIKKAERSTRSASERVSMTVKNDSGFGSFVMTILKICVLIFFGLIILFPFYYMVSISLLSNEDAMGSIPSFPTDPTLGSYFTVLNWLFVKDFVFSIIVMLTNVVLKVVVCMMLGYAFGFYNFKYKKLIWSLLLITMVIPEVAIISGQYKMAINLGLTDGLGLVLGLTAPFIATMFTAFMFRNAFETIPSEVKEAAMIDGISGSKFFFKVAIPMISSTVWTVVILTAFASWNSYVWPSLLLSDSEIHTMTIWLFRGSIDPDDNIALKNLEMAAAFVTVLPTLIIYFCFKNKINSTVAASGGTKG